MINKMLEKENHNLSKKSENLSLMSDMSVDHKQLQFKYKDLKTKYQALEHLLDKEYDSNRKSNRNEVKSKTVGGDFLEKQLLSEIRQGEGELDFHTFKNKETQDSENMIQKLMEEISHLRSENRSLGEKVSAFQYQSEHSEVNILRTLREKNLEIKKKGDELASLKREQMIIVEKMESFEYENEELKNIINEKKQIINDLIKDKSIASLKLRKCDKEINQLKKHNSLHESVREEQDSSLRESQTFRKELEELRIEYQDLKQNYQVKQDKLEQYRLEINKHSGEMMQVENNLNKYFTGRISEVEEEYKQKLNELEEQNKKLEKIIDNIKTDSSDELAVKDNEIENLINELKECKKMLSQLDIYIDENQQLNSRIESLQNDVKELKNERNYLFEELETKSKTFENHSQPDTNLYDEKIDHYNNIIKQLKGKIESLETENETVEKPVKIDKINYELLNENLINIDRIYKKDLKSYLNQIDWDIYKSRLDELLNHYNDMIITKKYDNEIKLKICYTGLKSYLVDEEGLVNFFNKLDIKNRSHYNLDLINLVITQFGSHYNDLKYKILCLTKFLTELFDNDIERATELEILKSHSFLDLKEIFVDSKYFDEENRVYVMELVEDYVRMKFAARKIQRFFRRLRDNRKKFKSSYKPTDYYVFKAGTGKIILKEILDKMGKCFKKLKSEF